jgi:hypothetical protein
MLTELPDFTCRSRDRLVPIDHSVGTRQSGRGWAIDELIEALDGMLNLVEQPTRRTLIEHVMAQVASSTYDTPGRLAAFFDVFLAGLVESREHVERTKVLSWFASSQADPPYGIGDQVYPRSAQITGFDGVLLEQSQ